MPLTGIVCRLSSLRQHPNADRLKLANASGYQVIVGPNSDEETLGVVFPAGGQLSDEFCKYHKLYRKDPDTGEKWSGYLGEKGRVKNLKLRNAVSDGLWLELSYLDSFGDTSKLKPGSQIGKFGDQVIFKKYAPARSHSSGSKNRSKSRRPRTEDRVPHFYRIGDTGQLRSFLYSIPEGAVINCSLKLHGTSHRTGCHLMEKDLPKWKRWLFEKLDIPTSEWKKVSGTRRTVQNPDNLVDPYHGGNFRQKAHDLINPRKGETVYCELVGYSAHETLIMPSHSPDNTGWGKQIRKQYGQQIVYKYGCEPGEMKTFVYKITQISPDGHETVLSPGAMRARASEMGLKCVPEIETFIYDGDIEALVEEMNNISGGADPIDASHPREGIVAWIDHEEMRKVLKFKGREFCFLEGIKYSDPNFIDPEDAE
jgi:hypothetical protein